MIVQFDLNRHSSAFCYRFIDNFLSDCDEATESYVKSNLDKWESDGAYPRVIMDHYYGEKWWFIIYNAYGYPGPVGDYEGRDVLWVAEMPKKFVATKKNYINTLEILNTTYHMFPGNGFDGYVENDSLMDLVLPPIDGRNKTQMTESFADALDSSLIDYSHDFEKSDYDYIYHPDVVASVNDSFSKMRYVRDEIMPKVKDFKIETCTIVSRMPKNFRVETYVDYGNGQWLSSVCFRWGIRYNFKIGSKVITSAFMFFEKSIDGTIWGYTGNSVSINKGTQLYEFITNELGATDVLDGMIWKFNI